MFLLGVWRYLYCEAVGALLAIGGSISDAAAHIISGVVFGDLQAVELLVCVSDDVAAVVFGQVADLRLRVVDLMPYADAGWPGRVMETMSLLVRVGWNAEA